MNLQISYSGGKLDYDIFDRNLATHSEQVEMLEVMCADDDETNTDALIAYYQLQTIRKARQALSSLESVAPACDVNALAITSSQILDVLREFDRALYEFRNTEVRDDDVLDDEDASEQAEDVIFDKIKNLRSSFRYFCEELRRVCANIDIEL